MNLKTLLLAMIVSCFGIMASNCYADEGDKFIHKLYDAYRNGKVLDKNNFGQYFVGDLSKQYVDIIDCMERTGDAIFDFDFLTDSQDNDDGAPFNVKVKRKSTNEYDVSFTLFKGGNTKNITYVLSKTPAGLRVNNVVVPGRYDLRSHFQLLFDRDYKSLCGVTQ